MFQVLIAEDDRELRQLFQHVLVKNGYSVTGVSDGREALQELEKGYYDIVISDVMMPVMDGIEATKKLREMNDEYCKNVPVIALTANAIVEARVKFADAGMNDFAAKPIDMKDICAKIRKWLLF